MESKTVNTVDRNQCQTVNVTETEILSSKQNWQTSVKILKEKWAYILQNEIATDLKLKLGEEEEEILCHQIVLIMASPIFESMLSIRWKVDGNENVREIKLPEVDPTVFRIILKFLYTEDFGIPESVSESANALDVFLSVLRLANVYFISSLRQKCLEYISKTEGLLNGQNVLRVYEESVRLSETELEKIALRIIGRNASFLQSTEFLLLSHSTLCRLLETNYLSVPEIVLFHAVYRWADTECCQQNIKTTPENLRKVLKDALHLIRFPVVGPDIFATEVVKTGLLSLEERVEILTYFSMSKLERKKIDKLTNFKTKPRICYHTLKRFEEIGTDSFDYSKNWRNLVFSVDYPIAISSLGFYGSSESKIGSTEYTVRIKIYENGSEEEDWRSHKLCGSQEEIVTMDSCKEIFHVKFPSPIEIEEDKKYIISFMLLGPKTHIGSSIQNVIAMDCGHDGKISFTFSEAKYKNNRYQVPEICFTSRF